ncbi:hypothetical protein ACGF5O_22035 [Streptomyces sp. NPDC048291]|uniref:hypothetical protein n=1 Tax=Streptomyces sp. NPDC048291 TaxID=3365530 RepID=UPI0037101291
MISMPVEDAVFTLQERAMRTHDLYQLDRIERALDELLRNPADDAVPSHRRIRSAMGHAYEALERRKEIVPSVAMLDEHDEPGRDEPGFHFIEVLDWIRTEPQFGLVERILLEALAHGDDAVTLADRHCLPLPRMRERISRARRTAKRVRGPLGLAA